MQPKIRFCPGTVKLSGVKAPNTAKFRDVSDKSIVGKIFSTILLTTLNLSKYPKNFRLTNQFPEMTN